MGGVVVVVDSIKQGLRQGCVLAPSLLNMALSEALQMVFVRLDPDIVEDMLLKIEDTEA